MVSGSTQVVAVIGHPIAQVKSPDNFNRYFAEHQIDSVMIPVDIAPEAVAAWLDALRGMHNMSGVLVTVPHKQRAAGLVDVMTPRAQHLGAVNAIRRLPDGRLQGDMLDGIGFLLAAQTHGWRASGRRALLCGCGGVGSAIAWSLCESGIAELALHDAQPDVRQRMHDKLASHFPAVKLGELPRTLDGVDLLVNGSPAGMAGFDALPLPDALLATLDAATRVADVVTAPVITPLLDAARSRGCAIQTGPEMAFAQMMLLGEFIGAMPARAEVSA